MIEIILQSASISEYPKNSVGSILEVISNQMPSSSMSPVPFQLCLALSF